MWRLFHRVDMRAFRMPLRSWACGLVLCAVGTAVLGPAGATVAASGPNLVFDAVPANSSVVAGDSVTASLRLGNGGDLFASSFWVLFFLDGETEMGRRFVGGLAPGQNVWVSSDPWTSHPGTHTVRILADALHQVDETDENDNEYSWVVDVRAADLRVLDLEVVHHLGLPLLAGGDVELRALVKNQGDAASAPSHLRFLLDMAAVEDVEVPRLAPGESRWVAHRFVLNLLANPETVTGIADPTSALIEWDETNNERTEPF